MHPKIDECNPTEPEFIGKKIVIILFKYISILYICHTVDSHYLKPARCSS